MISLFPSLHRLILGFSLITIAARLPAQDVEPAREQVGEVQGQPVYRDQMKESPNNEDVKQVFMKPVFLAYLEAHSSEVKPTEEELRQVISYIEQEHEKRIQQERPKLEEEIRVLEEQLENPEVTPAKRKELFLEYGDAKRRLRPPGRLDARFYLDHWKIQRHLYEKFGGGRLVWQQRGVEADEAIHKWLLAEESAGNFKISDAKLRDLLYEPWAKDPIFVIEKKEFIEDFLNPPWRSRQEAVKAPVLTQDGAAD